MNRDQQPRAFLDNAGSFWSGADLDTLAKLQGVDPVQSLESLRADFWPEDESLDDFVMAVRAWRQHDATHEFSARLP